MKLPIKKVVETEAKYLDLHLKVRDCFSAGLLDAESQEIASMDDYVPSFMPGEHCGDYVILKIDIDTGQIVNWKKNIDPKEVMKAFFKEEDE